MEKKDVDVEYDGISELFSGLEYSCQYKGILDLFEGLEYNNGVREPILKGRILIPECFPWPMALSNRVGTSRDVAPCFVRAVKDTELKPA